MTIGKNGWKFEIRLPRGWNDIGKGLVWIFRISAIYILTTIRAILLSQMDAHNDVRYVGKYDYVRDMGQINSAAIETGRKLEGQQGSINNLQQRVSNIEGRQNFRP